MSARPPRRWRRRALRALRGVAPPVRSGPTAGSHACWAHARTRRAAQKGRGGTRRGGRGRGRPRERAPRAQSKGGRPPRAAAADRPAPIASRTIGRRAVATAGAPGRATARRGAARGCRGRPGRTRLHAQAVHAADEHRRGRHALHDLAAVHRQLPAVQVLVDLHAGVLGVGRGHGRAGLFVRGALRAVFPALYGHHALRCVPESGVCLPDRWRAAAG